MKPPAGVPLLGLAEAAKACGVSVSTVRRKRPELAAYGAAQTAKGWRIPITALIAVGLMSRTTDADSARRHDAPTTPVMTPPTNGANDVLTGEIDALRMKLAEAEQRAAVAEAVAAERERIIQAQAMSLRMLEGSHTSQVVPSGPGHQDEIARTPSTAGVSPQQTNRGSLFKRWFGRP